MMRSPRHVAILLFASVVFAAAVMPVFARTAVVTTNDGRTYRGEVLVDNDKGVTLSISGVSTPLNRSDIRDVAYQLSIAEQFDAKRKAIDDDDLEARYKLAYWLLEEKAYALASKELEAMAKQFPDDGRVKALSGVVESRLKMQRAAEERLKPKPTPTPKPDDTSNKPDTKLPIKTETPTVEPSDKLTEEQVNAIKVYEIDFSARPRPVVRFDPDTISNFLAEFSEKDGDLRGVSSQRRFRTADGADQLQKMFDLRARDYYPKADVRTDPPAMLAFKRSIHRQYVLNYCGTNECHGREPHGGLLLFQARPSNEDTVYTNFYILNSWDRGEGFMIDRERPGDSYLYQFGLPAIDAKHKHPDVRGLRPRFRTTNDPMARAVINWIDMLYNPAPDYSIDYAPPGLAALKDAAAAAVEDAKEDSP